MQPSSTQRLFLCLYQDRRMQICRIGFLIICLILQPALICLAAVKRPGDRDAVEIRVEPPCLQGRDRASVDALPQ